MVIDVVLPVMIILGAGYLFGRFTDVDPSPISKLVIAVLSPALVFSFLVRTTLTSTEMFQIVLSVILFTIAMVLLTIGAMKWFKKKDFINPALLTTVFPNTGNFGLPIIVLAYGEEAYGFAVVIVVINFILMYSLGIYFASLSGASWKQALKNIFVLPTTYAAILAILINMLSIDVPDAIYEPLRMVGESMIPLALLLLGIYLSRTKVSGHVEVTVVASVLKVCIAPILIFLIVFLLGIEGELAKVIILQHAMPTAVIMTIIAAEYKAKENVVANITFITTLFSFISISLLLYILDFVFI